ncbi:MAG: hypothetical protein AB7O45_09440 [Alphaproteobacteria bacterium]
MARFSRLAAAGLAAGLLLSPAARAQTMSIENKTSLQVYVHFFAAGDPLMVVPCGQVRMSPQTTAAVARDTSPDCKRFDQLAVRANFTEFWGGFEGNCSFASVPWTKQLVIYGTQERLECY